MSMMRFAPLFPDIAERETRVITVFDPLPSEHPLFVPADEYGFDEWYCDERGCDCRRVMINVLGRHAKAHLATINHAFEPPTDDDVVPEQTFLDPLNRQSKWSPALLRMFEQMLLSDEAYRQRLLRHYRMFKNVVDDPAHPLHRRLREDNFDETAPSLRSRTPPPPPRRSKRKWR